MISVSSGVDLVEIERLENLNPNIKERFLRRVFTPAELEDSKKSPVHLAGKFAAKEAASKALGCGIGEIGWQDLEILGNPSGKPELSFHAAAQRKVEELHWSSWSVSISHTRQNAVAVVTALIDDQADRNEPR
jgi:holo-[acyl-carrier protein] synthase